MLNFFCRQEYYPPMPFEINLRYRIPFNKLKKWRVLNVGAGSGESGLALQFPFLPCKELTFLDIHQPYLDRAAARVYLAEKVNFINQDVRDFNTIGYDLVLMFDILEHLSNEDSFQVIDDIKCSQVVFIPLEKKFRPNVFGVKSQDHLSLWTEDNFKCRGFKTEVLSGFHEEFGEKFDALWAIKYQN